MTGGLRASKFRRHRCGWTLAVSRVGGRRVLHRRRLSRTFDRRSGRPCVRRAAATMGRVWERFSPCGRNSKAGCGDNSCRSETSARSFARRTYLGSRRATRRTVLYGRVTEPANSHRATFSTSSSNSVLSGSDGAIQPPLAHGVGGSRQRCWSTRHLDQRLGRLPLWRSRTAPSSLMGPRLSIPGGRPGVL